MRAGATVQVVVGGQIQLALQDVHPRVIERLNAGLSFPNPAYVSCVRFGRRTDRIPKEIALMEQDGERVWLPRGAIGLLREVLLAEGCALEIVDHRTVCPSHSFRFEFKLRDYQERAVARLCQQVQGMAVLPCGAGKGVIGAALIARIGQPALVLVHTHDLVEQWLATARDALGLTAGVVAAGKVDCAPITVATVQSLVALSEDALGAIGASFGTVVLDEAHHAPARVFRQVLSNIPAKYRFGLTATPERSDGLTPMLELCIGPELFRVGHKELVAEGYLVIPEVVPVATSAVSEARDYAGIIDDLVMDRARNELIVDLVVSEARAGRCVLILSARIEHCERLVELLGHAAVEAVALTSRVRKKERTAVLSRFREGALRVVCATSLADEGLNVEILDRLLLATPARAEGRTIQRLGRLMRPHPEKGKPVLYDLVDNIPQALQQFAARRRSYRKVLGSNVVSVPVLPSNLMSIQNERDAC